MKQIDLVIAGMDLSGTSTQVKFLTKHLQNKGLIVKDLKGTEHDALFHSNLFISHNMGYFSFTEFLKDSKGSPAAKLNVYEKMNYLMSKLQVASMVRTDKTSYIDPNSADVWLLEEPTRRGAGQTVRTFELCRGDYSIPSNQNAAGLAHSAYRSPECYRFRKPLLDAGKSVIRSRSEESGVYQIEDSKFLKQGVPFWDFIKFPGNEVAFSNPPTYIFVVHGSADMTAEEYKKIQKERNQGKIMDDYEKDVSYQLMINRRYATDFLEKLYSNACALYGSKPPQIFRFPLETTIEEKEQMMTETLDKILAE